ncbi:ATP-binding protein [Actinacidiphila sp. ITFR-21]|uniref:ATP-binding protein n=1 Tax=Actinacidiphila sp. ITFR-21 TaxID=3075199 RepID=UPI00288C4B84|nr:ATP-binding protein [Streptomyces sp. ITFR-21]WNI19680.1 ATP-binding protein [Streptomyces sp. ITFR-21]
MVAQEVPTSTTMDLSHGPAGVAEARRRLRTDLCAQDVPESVRDDAVLILSELVGNSCRHARPLGADAEQADAGRRGIRASWSVGADGLLVLEVTDGGGPTRPRPASPSLTAHGGRGLGIVGSLALRWGVRDAPGEVTVWVLLAVRGRHARRDPSARTGGGLPRGVPLELPLDLAESLDDLG